MSGDELRRALDGRDDQDRTVLIDLNPTGQWGQMTWTTSAATSADARRGRHRDDRHGQDPTELLPPIVDPIPGPVSDPTTREVDLGSVAWAAGRPVHDEPEVRPPSKLAAAGMALATIAVIVGAFVMGQVSVRTGAMEPPDLPRTAEQVMTTSTMSKLWPMQSQAQADEQCEAWRQGAWREYVVDAWTAHLAGPTGGKINVDRATVADFIGRVCRR